MRNVLPGLLVALTLFLGACAGEKGKAIRMGDRIMKAILVDVDFSTLTKYSIGDAATLTREKYEELGEEGIAELRKEAKYTKPKFKLDEKRSIFGKSVVQLVYEVRLGPDYHGFYHTQIELMGSRGEWRVSFYTL